MVRCGECGANYAAVGRDYLACGAARSKGICSNRRSIRRRSLEALILDGLKDRLMQPDLVKAVIAEFHAEINRQRDRQDQERALKHRELEQVTRKHDGLIDAIADGLRTTGLKAKLVALEEQKAKLEGALSDTPPPAPRLHPNLAEIYRHKVADLHGVLADPQTHDEALDILRSSIEQVIVRPRDDGFEVELVGKIAQMVAFGNQTTTKKSLPRTMKPTVRYRWLQGRVSNPPASFKQYEPPHPSFPRKRESSGPRNGSPLWRG